MEVINLSGNVGVRRDVDTPQFVPRYFWNVACEEYSAASTLREVCSARRTLLHRLSNWTASHG